MAARDNIGFYTSFLEGVHLFYLNFVSFSNDFLSFPYDLHTICILLHSFYKGYNDFICILKGKANLLIFAWVFPLHVRARMAPTDVSSLAHLTASRAYMTTWGNHKKLERTCRTQGWMVLVDPLNRNYRGKESRFQDMPRRFKDNTQNSNHVH